eukprot:1178359-Prorocentrum_minimum.AAC.2
MHDSLCQQLVFRGAPALLHRDNKGRAPLNTERTLYYPCANATHTSRFQENDKLYPSCSLLRHGPIPHRTVCGPRRPAANQKVAFL